MMQSILPDRFQFLRVVVMAGLGTMMVMALSRRPPALHPFWTACSGSIETCAIPRAPRGPRSGMSIPR